MLERATASDFSVYLNVLLNLSYFVQRFVAAASRNTILVHPLGFHHLCPQKNTSRL
jgi:hypothetical protein